MTQKSSILVAMSGGVDSSVTAALLKNAGYHVEGVFMILGQAAATPPDSPPDQPHETPGAQDARNVAEQLDIPLHIVDFRDTMGEIIDYFISEYRQARTPNPCLMCNRLLKFGRLINYAHTLNLQYFATGHYARIQTIQNQTRLTRALSIDKDQSYALFAIRRQRLDSIRLPLGDYAKPQVRTLAKEFNLPVHDKEESQEICFVPDDDYVRFVLDRVPELARPGKVVNSQGQILGEHQGIFRYTIGQRRGLGIALGDPAYVIRLDAQTNTVVLGSRDELMQHQLHAGRVNWLIDPPPTEPFDAIVQIRYNHRGAPARVTPLLDSSAAHTATVEFGQPVPAITPGQAAVFYDQHQAVIGGGWIEPAQ